MLHVSKMYMYVCMYYISSGTASEYYVSLAVLSLSLTYEYMHVLRVVCS